VEKRQLSHQSLFALLGLSRGKAARKMLMKLTPGYGWCRIPLSPENNYISCLIDVIIVIIVTVIVVVVIVVIDIKVVVVFVMIVVGGGEAMLIFAYFNIVVVVVIHFLGILGCSW